MLKPKQEQQQPDPEAAVLRSLVSLGVAGTRWQSYAEEAIAHLRRDAVRVGMLSCDVSPGALQMVREMARRGWVEYDRGAYRLTDDGRIEIGA